MPWPVYRVCLNAWLSPRDALLTLRTHMAGMLQSVPQNSLSSECQHQSWEPQATEMQGPISVQRFLCKGCAQEVKDGGRAAAYESQGRLHRSGFHMAGSKFKRLGSIHLGILPMLQYINMDINSLNVVITTQTFRFCLDPACIRSFLYWVPQFHHTK